MSYLTKVLTNLLSFQTLLSTSHTIPLGSSVKYVLFFNYFRASAHIVSSAFIYLLFHLVVLHGFQLKHHPCKPYKTSLNFDRSVWCFRGPLIFFFNSIHNSCCCFCWIFAFMIDCICNPRACTIASLTSEIYPTSSTMPSTQKAINLLLGSYPNHYPSSGSITIY